MTNAELDPRLRSVLSEESPAELEGTDFGNVVMKAADKDKRRRVLRRIALGVVLSLFTAPAQDFALAFSQVLVVALVQLENNLVAQLLAPINTVGTLLSMILFAMRAAHRRLFTVG